MLTPYFSISQDEEFILIDVQISHVRFNAKTIEMSVNEQVFIFSLPPYYLRLRLPFSCIDDERSHAEFDAKSDCVKIKIPKAIKGQHFPDLDLTAKLLARTNELGQKEVKRPLIEEMDVNNTISSLLENSLKEGEKFDWEIDQSLPEKVVPTNKYGFNNEYSEIVGVSVANGNDINELANPEDTPEPGRIMERLIKENIKFDPEYYAADYMMSQDPLQDDKDYKSLLEWSNPTSTKFLKWYKAQRNASAEDKQSLMPVEFTKEEQEKMLDLPKKSYLISEDYRNELYLLIVNLLFAYHFELRETEGDHTSESAWTIGKLTPQIACLDSKIAIRDEMNKDTPLKAAILTSIRRSLCYPLHRNYQLSMKVWDDVYYNLRGGKRLVLKSLLDLKELFRFHDVYYVYDIIWMRDLTAWVLSDQVTEMSLRYLAHDLKRDLESIDKSVITFEKANPNYTEDSDDEDDDGDDDEMFTLSIQELEIMANDGI